MSEVDPEKVRECHQEVENAAADNYCRQCENSWPCDAIQLADEVERLRKEIQQMNHESVNDTRYAGPYNERG